MVCAYELTVPAKLNPTPVGDVQIWYCVNKPDGSGGIIHDNVVLVGEVTDTHLKTGAATWAFILEKKNTLKTNKKYKSLVFKKCN